MRWQTAVQGPSLRERETLTRAYAHIARQLQISTESDKFSLFNARTLLILKHILCSVQNGA